MVRTGERVILLLDFGDEQLLTNALIITAVDRALRLTAPEPPEPGVGPHPEPWPDDDRLDPELLAAGDRRNVVDRYRYWRMEAIVADLDRRRHPFHVAIENWEHDRNIGTIVRTANAFLAAEVHIVGRRRWNRRGAMVTEQYQHLRHHATIDELVGWARDAGLPIVGVDNVPGAVPARAGRAARGAACCCSARRGRVCRPRPGPRRRSSCRSASSDRPAR